jgi:SAM-dependent methyltransferase
MDVQKSLHDPAHASAFGEPSVIAAYPNRPTYPAETFDFLLALIPDGAPRCALDLGCGTGLLARPLAERLARVDAVDPSRGMIDAGRAAPGGERSNLRWIVGSAETAALEPPYGLATAGDSLHWMDWARVLPRVAAALAPGAVLAVLGCRSLPEAWSAELRALIQRYSTNQKFRAVDVAGELAERGAFELHGRHTTAPVPLRQSIDAYVESFHGRASFSRERMRADDAAAFDAAVRDLVRASGADEVQLQCVADIAWGRPLPSQREDRGDLR